MEFKLDLGSLRFESSSGQTCSACGKIYSYNDSASTMLTFDVPDPNYSYGILAEHICTTCMWNTFKTFIKLLNSGKKLI
jgi:hypothetical protein